jgi:hypothetical protein
VEELETHVVITNEGYLILELLNQYNMKEEKMAILKLK